MPITHVIQFNGREILIQRDFGATFTGGRFVGTSHEIGLKLRARIFERILNNCEIIETIIFYDE
jgi:hypothetical protein